jgi:hypothetical protein
MRCEFDTCTLCEEETGGRWLVNTPGDGAAKAEDESVNKAATAASVFFMGTSFLSESSVL